MLYVAFWHNWHNKLNMTCVIPVYSILVSFMSSFHNILVLYQQNVYTLPIKEIWSPSRL